MMGHNPEAMYRAFWEAWEGIEPCFAERLGAAGLRINDKGEVVSEEKIRTFGTGATRDNDTDKPDYEGFLSPLVLAEYARYMHKNRKQSDGQLRASDNWQKGIPRDQYIKSAWRHFMDWWVVHRARGCAYDDLTETREAICALMFNAMGYLHELLEHPPVVDTDGVHRVFEAAHDIKEGDLLKVDGDKVARHLADSSGKKVARHLPGSFVREREV